MPNLPSFTPSAGASPPAAASPAPTSVAELFSDESSSSYEPSTSRTDYGLGDGFRQTIDTDTVPEGLMPDEDRTFELRQCTIAETCRAHRFARVNDNFDLNTYVRLYTRYNVRKIGGKTGAALSDAELDRWFDRIGIHGFAAVKSLADALCDVRPHEAKAFSASKRDDIMSRRFQRTLAQSVVPGKRWAARVGIPGARWISTYADEDEKQKTRRLTEGRPRLVVGGRWVVGDAVADEGQVLMCNRDLGFTMKEMTVLEMSQAADLVEDPEDNYAIRVMATMLAIIEIGGMPLGSDAASLTKKLEWMEDIGPRGRQQVTGLYSQLHEVDPVRTASFRETATPLD